ncbi:hypothetical protein GYA49_03000 [Candidatus Beckwithbacteria bacterium]|nr:hypothetical protein [Candidatus Beckwithbacteria bacterium]
MSDQTDKYISLLKPYALSEEESRIYLFLLASGFCPALTISRKLHLGRTKVYRLLDTLKKKQLVEFQVLEHGMRFGATHPSKLQHLIIEQEQELEALKKNLSDLVANLSQIIPQSQSDSKVLYYQGVEGLKQVSYNLTKAKGLIRVLEMEHLDAFLPEDFSENLRQEFVQRKITTYDLTNKQSFPAFTKVTELIKNYSQFRYVDPKFLTINFEVLIYNDVYATYTYKNKEVFCVEIYNSQLAQMQKQLYDYIWNQAQPMKFIDELGAAEIV